MNGQPKPAPSPAPYPFLQGGGEMGHLTRTHDWTETSLGPPNQWPLSLRTTVGIVLHSAFPMFLFWGDELICFYNDAYRPSLGNNGKHPALGKPGKEVWPEAWPIIEQVADTGEPVFFTDQLVPIYRNGRLEDVYWTFSYSPAYNDDGQISGGLVTCTETTEKVANAKLQQEKSELLRESEHYFRQLIDTAPAIIWETRPDGYCTYLNRQWYDLTGQTPTEAEGLGWLDATHPDDKDESGRLFLEANQTQTSFYTVYRLRHKDGSYRWAIDKGSPRFGADGSYQGMIGTVVDIHDQKLAEEDVTRFKFMADNASDPFILMRADGTFAYLNQLALDRWGYTADEARHLRVPDVDPIYQDEVFNAAFARAQREEILPFETLHQRKDGHIYPVEVNMGGLLLNGQPHLFAVARDLTDRKKAEANLRASEQRFQAAVAAVQGILWTNNANGEMEGEQPGWAALTGQTYADYHGYGWASAVHPDDAQPTVAAWQEALARRGLFEFEHRVRLKDGQYEPFSIRAIPLFKPDGTIREWVGVHTNISEQRKAETALRTSEARLRSLIANAPVAIALFIGRDLVIDLPNQRFIDVVGKGPDIAGKPLREVMPELVTENQPFLQILDDVYITGQMFQSFGSQVDIVRHGVMTHNYYNIAYSPLYNEAGEVYAILDIAVDVTGQILAQQQVAESERRFRALLESMPQMAWTNMPTGEVDFYNQRWYDYTGLTFEQTRDRGWEGVVHPDDMGQTLANFQHALTNDVEFVVENRYKRADGQYRWHLNRARPLHDESGQTVQWVGTATDIQDQKELEAALEQQVQARTQQLQASVQDLQRSNENLQQFAYVASHDLQEPLRKIQSFGDMLRTQYGEQLGETGNDFLSRMQTSANRMSVLIRDLLTYSRISTQQDTSAQVSLTNLVKLVLTDLELAITETGAEVLVAPLPTLPGDGSQLGQLFQNLISNALKFRRPNVETRIRISTDRVVAADLPPTVRPTRLAAAYHRIDVSDNGIGFDEKYLTRIFQVFQRLHSKSEFAGTGIGLAICEKVAANHGGAITATSKLGEGATFSVFFPV